jgi:hypothetical protein
MSSESGLLTAPAFVNQVADFDIAKAVVLSSGDDFRRRLFGLLSGKRAS